MLNQRKNKKFHYESRFSEENNARKETYGDSIHELKRARKTAAGKRKSLPLLLVLLGIIIAVMYYLSKF